MSGDQCSFCVHWEGSGKCPAYPDGIPEMFRSGEVAHDSVAPNQAAPVSFAVDPSQTDAWLEYSRLFS